MKSHMESIVKLENDRIVGISSDYRVMEYIDGKWVKPTAPVYGADFYEGKPVKEEELQTIKPKNTKSSEDSIDQDQDIMRVKWV